MQPGAAPTASSLPTGGEIRVARRDISAAQVARSLLIGAFQPPTSDDLVCAPDRDGPLPRPWMSGPRKGRRQSGLSRALGILALSRTTHPTPLLRVSSRIDA